VLFTTPSVTPSVTPGYFTTPNEYFTTPNECDFYDTLRHRMASSMAYSYHIGFLVDVLGYGGMITVLYHTDTYVQYRICECNRAASDDAVMQ